MKKINPHMHTSLEKDTFFLEIKYVIMIGAKNDRIIMIVVEGATSGKTLRLFTNDISWPEP